MLGLVRIGITFSLLLPTALLGQQPPLPRFSSRAEAIRAIAAQDRTINEARVRLQAASSAESTARTAFEESDQQLTSAVMAEVRRTPQLEAVQHLFTDQTVPPVIAGGLNRRRQGLSEARATLERLRREGESMAAAGLASDASVRRLLEDVIPFYERDVAWMSAFSGSLDRTKAARDRRQANLTNLRRDVSAKKQFEDVLRAALLERARLFHSMGKQYVPRYLRSVRVTQGQGDGAREVYAATVSEPEQFRKIDEAIEFLMGELANSERKLAEYRREFLNAESRFVETAVRWQQTHSRYSDSIKNAYYLRMGLEIADSAIAVRKLEPAGVLFELAWRIGEYATTDSYRIEEPRVDATIAAHRDDLIRRLQQATQANRPQDLLTDNEWLASERAAQIASPRVFIPSSESLKNHLYKEQDAEFLKGVIEISLIDGLVRSIAGESATESKRELFKRTLYSFMDQESQYLLDLIVGDATSPLIKKAKDSWITEKGKDFLLSAGVTAGKEALTAAQRQELYRAAQEVALMDVEYLLRQHEYWSKGALYRATGRKLAVIEAGIGAFLETRSQTGGSRTLSVQTNETIAADAPVRIHLQFSGPVDGAVITIVEEAGMMVGGEKQFLATGDAQGNMVTDIPVDIPAGTFIPGKTRLSIFTSVRGMGITSEFDANPRTVAYHESAASVTSSKPRFRDLEFGGDENHSLTVGNTVSSSQGPSTSEIFSRFDRDSSGWTVVGDAQSNSVQPTYRGSGGKPGGYIEATDDAAGGVWYWSAPATFYTGLSRTWRSRGQLMMSLTFDLRQSDLSSPFKTSDVVMRGGGLTLAFYSPSAPGTSWTSFKVPLTAASWRNEDAKRPATESEMAVAMAALTSLWIRGEYRQGEDIGGLDNVGWQTQRGSRTEAVTGPGENTSPMYRVVGVAATDQLTIRRGPGAANALIAEIPAGASGVKGLGEERQVGTTTWIKIAYRGAEGWVNKRFLARQ